MQIYLPILILFIGGSVLTIGDIVMKKWTTTNSIHLFLSGLFIYLIGLIFLALSYKYKNIAVASTMFVVFNIVTLSFVSWLYFKESLSNFQLIGIFLGIASVAFLELA